MFNGFMMVCNYSPRGNIENEPVFKRGRDCTDCQLDRATCSRLFTGLCGLDNSKSNKSIEISNLSYIVLLFIVFVNC